MQTENRSSSWLYSQPVLYGLSFVAGAVTASVFYLLFKTQAFGPAALFMKLKVPETLPKLSTLLEAMLTGGCFLLCLRYALEHNDQTSSEHPTRLWGPALLLLNAIPLFEDGSQLPVADGEKPFVDIEEDLGLPVADHGTLGCRGESGVEEDGDDQRSHGAPFALWQQPMLRGTPVPSQPPRDLPPCPKTLVGPTIPRSQDEMRGGV